MESATLSLFDGLSATELAWVREVLECRRIAAGATICAAGDSLREMYVLQSGAAEVFDADHHGAERVIARVGPGETIGERALLTGHPPTSSVRALDELELLAISHADFERLCAQIPRIAQNLGALLSRRLAYSNRAAVAQERGHITRLLDEGCPPLMGYALACSVAWHTRRPVLLLALAADPHAELAALGENQALSYEEIAHGGATPPRRAALLIAPPEGDFAPEALRATLMRLRRRFDYVLIQAPDSFPAGLADRTVNLAGDGGEIRQGRPGHTMKAWHEGIVVRPDAAGVLHIPPLSLADENALRRGLLPTRTLTGRAMGWAARDLAGLKVGLALGAGSVKGFAHFGAWRALERLAVEADYLSGSGIGALVGAMYALGFSADEAARALYQSSGWPNRSTWPARALLTNKGLQQTIESIAHERRIESLALPFGIVAADVTSGQEVVLRRGLLRTALLATLSTPGVYPPVPVGTLNLVDGGLVNPVPMNVAAELGADVVLAVSLSGWTPPPVDAAAETTRAAPPKLLQVVTQAVEIMQSKIAPSPGGVAAIQIVPRFSGVSPLSQRLFIDGQAYVDAGDEAVERALPRIAAALPWIR